MTGLILQQLVNALTIGAIYALIALGYTMVYGVLRLINFAHSEMFMVGAYSPLPSCRSIGDVGAAPTLASRWRSSRIRRRRPARSRHRAVAYRPLRSATRLAPMLSALGLSLFFQSAVQIFAGPQPIRFPSIFPAAPSNWRARWSPRRSLASSRLPFC